MLWTLLKLKSAHEEKEGREVARSEWILPEGPNWKFNGKLKTLWKSFFCPSLKTEKNIGISLI